MVHSACYWHYLVIWVWLTILANCDCFYTSCLPLGTLKCHWGGQFLIFFPWTNHLLHWALLIPPPFWALSQSQLLTESASLSLSRPGCRSTLHACGCPRPSYSWTDRPQTRSAVGWTFFWCFDQSGGLTVRCIQKAFTALHFSIHFAQFCFVTASFQNLFNIFALKNLLTIHHIDNI